MKIKTLSAILAGLLMSYQVVAHAESKVVLTIPRVDVVGSYENLPDIAGSAQILDDKDMESSHVFTVNEALRKVPGVHARDEEGFGLRPNIGMRGLNPTRSTKITLLEDGIPLAYAPYGDNASYYHPMVDRYERIEVLKGAGSMLFGPQTVGGVVNYITPIPQQEPGGFFQGTLGNRDYFNGKVRFAGNGLLVDYGRKQGDGARDNMEHVLDDLNLKFVTGIGERQALTLRANYYKEDSVLTYTGLTQAEYENFGAEYNPFKNDHFDAKRYGFSATHDAEMNQNLQLTTNFYYSYFTRDWWRQSSTTTDGQCGGAFTAARVAGSRVDSDSCNSIQGRLRDYTTWGVEPRLSLTHGMGELQLGVKAHFEKQERKQENANAPSRSAATVVTLAEDNLRETDAYSVFVSNRFDIGSVSVTPILRHENIEADRINRLTGVKGSTSISKTLPGLGATWNPVDTLTVFASIHKGFAPPRVEDLIGGTGTVTEVNPEESTNFELGMRSKLFNTISFQTAYFRNDYDNLIAVGSIAGGSTPLSEGEALFEGFELSAQSEVSSGVFGRMAYTWIPTAKQETPFYRVDTGSALAGSGDGNRQPYTPKQTLTAAMGYEKGPWRGEFEGQYVGEQYSDFANTELPTANGQVGKIDDYTIFNASLNYKWQALGTTLFITGKNLADRTYIVDRTRGIQVGMPRLVQVGFKYGF